MFARLRTFDWSFDAEALLIASQLGYRIGEVPVAWEDRAGTKVRLGRDAARALLGLARIRANSSRGLYRERFEGAPTAEAWQHEPPAATKVSR